MIAHSSTLPAPALVSPAFRARGSDPGLEEWLAAALRRLRRMDVESRRARQGPESPHAPPRSRVTRAELVELLNRELAARPNCAGVTLTAERLVPGPRDASGCNWSPVDLTLHVTGFLGPLAMHEMREVVSTARLRFEVVERGR